MGRGSPLPRIAYTALCGVGKPLAARLLATAGARDVVYVADQCTPRADFAGLAYPNPESAQALTALVELAESASAELALAHDPDADRLAVLARDASGALRLLSGDDVGAVLGWFLLQAEPRPEQTLLVSTFVSGGLLEAICLAHGARFTRTHTGFKWIASRARQLSAGEGLRFLFGYEEAIGYAFGALGDDKDGLAALYVLCALIRMLAQRSQRLPDLLDQLARAHGLYVSRQLTVQTDPHAGAPTAHALFDGLCRQSTDQLLSADATRQDFRQGPDPVPLLIVQDAELRLCVRPSGTEPKLKLYLHGRTDVVATESVAQARARIDARLVALARRLRGLIRGGEFPDDSGGETSEA